jgi:NADH-quinone oxidoreductase subunit L
MLLFQDAVQAAGAAADTAAAHGSYEPRLLGWIVLLPLLGFLINGVAGLVAARRAHPATRNLGQAHASEQEGHDHGDEPHPTDDHGHGQQERGWTHTLPSFVAPGVVMAAFAIALVNFFGMLNAGAHEPIVRTYWSWMAVGNLQIDAAILLDPLSILMVLIITGVGSLIHLFSIGYMRNDPGYPRFMAYMNFFVFFMLILVLGASYPAMFVGWEGVGLCSYLLIGFWYADKPNVDAGNKAFIANRIGDFGFLMAMFLLFANTGSLSFPEVFEQTRATLPYAGPAITLITLFFFLGATGKSAQIPLFVWLPDAMAGPTPVSALIHAATMVTAGVYMIVRSSTLFALAPVTSLLVALVGTLTALVAATIGTKQWDIKKVLAYSTVSQLGFMIAAVGMGAYASGIFHLMTHAFFKALLFLGAGAVIHAMHEALHATHSEADAQDMRNMGGLSKYLPVTFVTMGLATLAIAGIPPFAGFFSKDEIVGAAWTGMAGHSALAEASLFGISGATWMGVFAVLLSVAAFLTAYYMGRLMIYTFFGPNRTGEVERGHLHEVNWTMTVPLAVLGVLSVIGGFLNVESEVPIVRWFDFGQGAALHEWLHPVVAGADEIFAGRMPAGEVAHAAWPIVLAIVLGIGGLASAWLLLRPAALRTPADEPNYSSVLGRLLYRKWYVDEIYEAFFLRPIRLLSQAFFSVVDRGLIDGIVDGSGRLSQGLGLLAGRVQTGQLNTYAFMFVIGVLAVLGAFVWF